MIREHEAAKLRREMHRELDGAYSIFLKCVVGIVVLFTLVIISPSLGLQRDGQSVSAKTAPQAVAAKAAPH